MKIKIFPFENEINFSENNFSTLEIQNKKLFINIIESIYSRYEGGEGIERISLINGDKEVDFSKNILLIHDILSFDLNDRKILTKFYSIIDKTLVQDIEKGNELSNLFYSINKEIDILLNDFEFGVTYKEEFIFQEYLKMLALKISYEDSKSFLRKTYQILDIVREIMDNRIIIFINSKTFFQEEELIEIIKYVNYNKNKVLFIESNFDKRMLGEIKYIIDEDYEEFIETI